MGVALRGCSTNRHAPRAASVRYTGVKQHQQSYHTHVLFFMFFMLVDIFLRFMWSMNLPKKTKRARERETERGNDKPVTTKTTATAFIPPDSHACHAVRDISFCLSAQCASRRASPCSTVHGVHIKRRILRLRSTLHRRRSGLGRRRPSKPLSSSRRRGGRATTSRAAGVASPSPDRRLTPRGPPYPRQGRCSARRRRQRASRPS